MPHTGSCMCGAARFAISKTITETGACHCEMCRKWSGGVYLGVHVGADDITIETPDAITTFTSSPWAERAFCSTCGSCLYYKVTADGPMKGDHHVGLGTLNETDGIMLREEIYIDCKPEGYTFAGVEKQMTKAEIEAMFAPIP